MLEEMMAMIAANAPGGAAQPILTPALLALSGTMVASMASFYLLLSAVPAHAAALGGDFAAGLSTGVLMATTIAGEFAAPRLIARLGRRAAMTIALLVLALPCLATFSSDLAVVLASCAARGFGLGLLLVAACGLAATLAPPSRQAEAMGVYGVASAIPAIVAVPLGPWALAVLGPVPTAAAAAVLGLIGLAGVAVVPGRIAQTDGDTHPNALPAMRIAAWPAAALAIGAIVVGASITFLPLAHHEATTGTIMLALLLQGLAAAAARWAAGRPVDRHGPQGAMVAGVVLVIAAMLLLALPVDAAILTGMTLSGIAFGVLQSASLAQLLYRAPPAQADGASALWNAAYDAGLGVGGIGLGALAAATGYGTAFVTGAVMLALFGLMIFLRFERPNPMRRGATRKPA
jgi:predicted MFS family arabinose efflux permease